MRMETFGERVARSGDVRRPCHNMGDRAATWASAGRRRRVPRSDFFYSYSVAEGCGWYLELFEQAAARGSGYTNDTRVARSGDRAPTESARLCPNRVCAAAQSGDVGRPCHNGVHQGPGRTRIKNPFGRGRAGVARCLWRKGVTGFPRPRVSDARPFSPSDLSDKRHATCLEPREP
jgi:hypothetical protein